MGVVHQMGRKEEQPEEQHVQEILSDLMELELIIHDGE